MRYVWQAKADIASGPTVWLLPQTGLRLKRHSMTPEKAASNSMETGNGSYRERSCPLNTYLFQTKNY